MRSELGESAREALALGPPRVSFSLWGWLRRNLFNTWYNTLLTFVALWIIYQLLAAVVPWAILNATVTPDPAACKEVDGACWTYVVANHYLFLVGTYPFEERWRPFTAGIVLLALLALAVVPRIRRARVYLVAWVVVPLGVMVLISGSERAGLTPVESDVWGGLLLTLLLTVFGLLFAFPLGVVLALGRQSELPVIRALSVSFIELIRGVPLITVLFMASVMLPLFVPTQVEFDKLLRALVGIMLFWSAYMAEVVRGGLQAIPRGQEEAAKALGMGYWQRMALIVLPQALKLVIPGIVNTFIALFKDTTLVLIIGLFDLLAIIRAGLTDSNWLGFATEGYVFAALVFWVFCFSMSRYSQYIERRLHTGHRN